MGAPDRSRVDPAPAHHPRQRSQKPLGRSPREFDSGAMYCNSVPFAAARCALSRRLRSRYQPRIPYERRLGRNGASAWSVGTGSSGMAIGLPSGSIDST